MTVAFQEFLISGGHRPPLQPDPVKTINCRPPEQPNHDAHFRAASRKSQQNQDCRQ
jgi:hypothetical protein